MFEQTKIQLPIVAWKLDYSNTFYTIGSCFAEVIGRGLAESKFRVLSNPFGTLFSPEAISNRITEALQATPPPQELYYELSEGIWLHHHYHSDLWARSQPALEALLVEKQQQTAAWLAQTDVLVLTLGSAFVYRHLATGLRVANCHKRPAVFFEKELMTVEEVLNDLRSLFEVLLALQPKMKIVLSVSPVRHTRDTLVLNQVSKSVLRIACHQLQEEFAAVMYFPAYEILLDELRDYRYYDEDLVHPSPQAERYILEQFAEIFFAPEAQDLRKRWQAVRTALAHNPRYGSTVDYLHFLKNTLQKLIALSDRLSVEGEIEEIRKKMEELKLKLGP